MINNTNLNETYKIELLPIPEEGEYDNLGYFLGMTIVGEDPYTSEIYAYFRRREKLVIYNLTKTSFEHGEDVIADLIEWLKIQLLDQHNNGCQTVKLIVEKKNGKLIFDMP